MNLEQQFIAVMAKAAQLIEADPLVITPPAPGLGWAVQVATEEQRDLLALALQRSGMLNRAVSRHGRHYIFEQ